MRKMSGLFVSFALVAALGLACGDDTNPQTPDKGVVDQQVQSETNPWPDLGVQDTTPQPDQATGDMALDTATGDTAGDTVTADTVTPDTATADTATPGDGGSAVNVCAKATVITMTGGKGTVQGEVKSTDSYNWINYPKNGCTKNSSYGTPGAELIYKVTLKAGVKYLFTAVPSSSYNHAIYIFSACATPLSTCLAGTDAEYSGDTEQFTYTPTTAGDVYVGVDSRYTAASSLSYGTFTLTVEELTTPTHDTCAGAKLLTFTANTITETGNTMAANNDVKLTSAGCTGNTTDGPDVFYKVNLTAGSSYKLSLGATGSWNEVLYLFTSCSNVAGTCSTGMGADASTSSDEEITFKPTTSGTYTIGVAGRGATDMGAFTLTIDAYPPITNDTCATAKAITMTAGKGTANGHTIGATDTVNLPTSGCTGDDTEGGDVWHKVTLTAGKSYLISSKAASGYDHAIYMLSSCANPTTACVAGDDAEYTGGTEYFTFTPTTTATYYIAVDTSYATTSSYASGSYDLTVEEYTAPTNDTCATAKVVTLTAGKGTVSATKLGATSALAQCGTQTLPATDLFYKFTPTVGKQYKITFKPQGSGGRFGVWDGNHGCVASAVQTACGVLGSTYVTGGSSGSLTITSVSGDIYFVADGISTPLYDVYSYTFEVEQLP